MTKSDKEIMAILEAFDLTRCAHSAARLVGVDEKTVTRYVAIRDSGRDPLVATRRARTIDAFRDKIEELVARSDGQIRADVVHQRLVAMGFSGSDRATRRVVAEAKAIWKVGHRPVDRPWTPEPGMWLQFRWADGPRIAGLATHLFYGWLPWSRYRFVIPTWDRTPSTLASCVDVTLRGLGGAPAYLVTDDAGMVSVDHVTAAVVRSPEFIAVGRHYGCQARGCQPFSSDTVGRGEFTAGISRADLLPGIVTMPAAYDSFAALAQACAHWRERINQRSQRKFGTTPATRLVSERRHLRALPARPHTIEPQATALSTLRLVDTAWPIQIDKVRDSGSGGYSAGRDQMQAGAGAHWRL